MRNATLRYHCSLYRTSKCWFETVRCCQSPSRGNIAGSIGNIALVGRRQYRALSNSATPQTGGRAGRISSRSAWSTSHMLTINIVEEISPFVLDWEEGPLERQSS